jgi:hypothetical protein
MKKGSASGRLYGVRASLSVAGGRTLKLIWPAQSRGPMLDADHPSEQFVRDELLLGCDDALTCAEGC